MAEFQSHRERLNKLNSEKERARLRLENLKRTATSLIKLAKQHCDVFPGNDSSILNELQSCVSEVGPFRSIGTSILNVVEIVSVIDQCHLNNS